MRGQHCALPRPDGWRTLPRVKWDLLTRGDVLLQAAHLREEQQSGGCLLRFPDAGESVTLSSEATWLRWQTMAGCETGPYVALLAIIGFRDRQQTSDSPLALRLPKQILRHCTHGCGPRQPPQSIRSWSIFVCGAKHFCARSELSACGQWPLHGIASRPGKSTRSPLMGSDTILNRRFIGEWRVWSR